MTTDDEAQGNTRENESFERLIAVLEQVTDQRTFVAFLAALGADREDSVQQEKISPSSPYGPDANGWENGSIEMFLDGAARWAEDNFRGKEPDENPWRAAARIMHAGKYYE